FGPEDRSRASAPVLVNETMARAYWGRTDVLGECVEFVERPGAGCSRIIGVVSDEHAQRIVEAKPAMQLYQPPADSGFGSPYVIAVRTDPALRPAVGAAMSNQLNAVFAGWATPRVRSMTDYLAPQLRPWRVGASLFSVAGLLALLVAMVGIYSSLAY